MSEVQPRHVICALGNWKSFDPIEAMLQHFGPGRYTLDREFSQLEPDARMRDAFEASRDRVVPSIGDEDWAAIDGHGAVAYILSPRLPPEKAQALSAETLAIVMLMFQAGAVAMKGESAGIAHGRARWLELAAGAVAEDPLARASALHGAWVRRPIADEGVLYSCGMHLLGERDVEIAGASDALDALEWLDALAIYLLAEKPSRGIKDGEGFRQSEGGERRVMKLQPCTRYEQDDFMFNPYGYVRL